MTPGLKITTTIRFDPALHDRLSEFVHEAGRGLSPKRRPSKDAIVQRAVTEFLDRERGK